MSVNANTGNAFLDSYAQQINLLEQDPNATPAYDAALEQEFNEIKAQILGNGGSTSGSGNGSPTSMTGTGSSSSSSRSRAVSRFLACCASMALAPPPSRSTRSCSWIADSSPNIPCVLLRARCELQSSFEGI